MSFVTAMRSVPRGMVHVGAGLLVLGLSSYGFLVVSARAVSPSAFAALSVLYMLVYTFIPGIFLPYEQELARALSERRAHGVGAGPLLRRVGASSGRLVALLVLATAALSPVLVGRMFNHSVGLLLALLISVVCLALAYVTRGVFAGIGRYGHYGGQLAIEGISRLVACAGLAAAGVSQVGAYGLALGAAFLVGVLFTLGPLRELDSTGPPVSAVELGSTIRWLIAGALISLGVLNAGPVIIKVFEAEHAGGAGRLLAGLVLARLPLFLFAAVQAALVPTLAASLARREFDRFRTELQRIVVLLVALAAVATAVLAIAGPQLLHVFFGAEYELGRRDLVVLGVGTGLYMVASAYGNALLSLQRFSWAALGWLVGAVGFALAMAAPASLFSRVEYSFVGGGLASALAFTWLLRRAVASVQSDPASVRPEAVSKP